MISREEAREILKEMHDYMHEGYITDLAYGGKQDEAMERNIEALSVAITFLSQPERPKGRWVQCFEDWRRQIEGDECSICGFQYYGSYIRYHKFCPNCGADMRGGLNENTKR